MATTTGPASTGASSRRRTGERHIAPGSVARAGLVLIALWAIANGLWIARNAFFLAFLAILFAVLFGVLARPLVRLGMRRGTATATAVLLFLGLLTLAGWALWPAIDADLPRIREAVVPAIDSVTGWIQAQYTRVTGQPAGAGGEGAGRSGGVGSVVSGAWPVLSSALGAASGLIIALFAGAYFAAEPVLYADGLVRLAPESARPRIRSALGEAGETLRHWLLATLFNMVSVGVVTTVGLMLIGVPAALPLGVLAGLGEFVPYFGPIVTALPAIAAGFVVSPTHALWVFLLFLILQQVQGNLVTPMIMRRVVNLPPALTVLVQSVMGVLFGVIGLLVAVPALAAGLVIVRETYVRRLEEHE